MKANELLGANVAALFGTDEFHRRHIGPSVSEEAEMLAAIGYQSRHELIADTIPAAILLGDSAAASKNPARAASRTASAGATAALEIGEPVTEANALAELAAIAAGNQVWRSYIGAGYHNTITPEPIRRNVLENPGWYTAYTPYQAEIAQGRLEALMNFQQMVIDLTGLEVANASLLDEATAAAEAMTLIRRAVRSKSNRYFVEATTHPQVVAVIRTRARWLGIDLAVGPLEALEPAAVFGAHFQSPDTEGRVRDFSEVIAQLHAAGAKACIGTDLLASLLVNPAGAQGADVAIGSAQRFGVPLGYGGPHAAFMATREALVRMMPGRIIGVSKDAAGNAAYRMALQTREQHIRRDKATSNICTAQALLANMAAFYAVYHGPEGLLRIALRTHAMARLLVQAVAKTGKLAGPLHPNYFDTVAFDAAGDLANILERAAARRINLRQLGGERLAVAFDETVGLADVADVAYALTGLQPPPEQLSLAAVSMAVETDVLTAPLRRKDAVLTHPVFNRYHSETEFMRYLKKLENRDISLVHSMIPLGSCTMKLNAASEMSRFSSFFR